MIDRLLAWARAHRVGLLRALWVLLAVCALYLIAANVFLNTAIGERTINRKPERFSAQWWWAVSVYPGHIHARGLDLGGRARPTAWRVTASSASGRIALLPLLRRELRFANINAHHVEVITDRSRRDPSPPPAAAPATAGGGPWTLRFDAIRTDSLLRLQFDRWRIDGGGRARFGMSRQLRGGPLEIFASMLRMPDASVRSDDRVVLQDARIALDFSLPRHRPANVRGKRKLAIADAQLSLQGRAPGVTVTGDADGRLAWTFDGAPGTLHARLALRDGALQPGGQVRLLAPLHVATPGDDTRRYQVRADVDVDATGLVLRATMPPQGGRPDHLDATLRTRHRQLDPTRWRALFEHLSGRVELQWRFGSLAWINPLLSEQRWLRLDGAALLDANLRLVDGALAAGSRARLRDAGLRAEILDSVFRGTASVDARVDGDGPRLRMAIVAPRFELVAKEAPRQAYVRGQDLRLDLEGSVRPVEFRRTLQAHLRFADAAVPDLRAYGRYLPGDSLQLLGGSGRLAGDLQVDAAGEVVRADVDVTGRRADIRFGVSRMVGNLRLVGRLQRSAAGARDYRIERLDLSLDRVRLVGGTTDDWWAKVDLGGARLDWRPPIGLDGDVRLHMKDASLLLSLFAERSAFPRWIGNVVDDGEVRATARTHVAGDLLVLDAIHAGNDRVDLQARLKIDDGEPEGDLYARWGVLGVGAELRGGTRRLRTIGARRWYESQPALLPLR